MLTWKKQAFDKEHARPPPQKKDSSGKYTTTLTALQSFPSLSQIPQNIFTNGRTEQDSAHFA